MSLKALTITILCITFVEANWRQQRVVNFQTNMGQMQAHSGDVIKKYLPARFDNLWGLGNGKVVDNSALTPHNIDDYKMASRQRQVFAWRPMDIPEW
ncbi:unnamed protein product [Caenorhabditis bovis]|uniref:Uncharacterized protein n=1 Tax=Caenorhabditis bovis TaxID=2654633 RepID=A0A8S1E2U3_9PELO|nr:unnamed protein product [Caenorhabditis bovis]